MNIDKKKLTEFWQTNQTTILIVGAALLLTIFLLAVRAGAPFASFEAESANLAGNTVIKSEAGLSGGKYVEFSEEQISGPIDDGSSCSGVAISPGDNWQTKIDANPVGTTFCIRAGAHTGNDVHNLNPKDSQKFIGETDGVATNWFRNGTPTSVIDGGGSGGSVNKATSDVFVHTGAGSPNNLVFKNLEIRNFDSAVRHAAIGARYYAAGWFMENLDVHHNSAVGVRMSNGFTLRYSKVHHNGIIGMLAAGESQSNKIDGFLIEHTNIYTNNTQHTAANISGAEAGGSKFLRSRNVVVRYCSWNDNDGPGLWFDGYNDNITIHNNLAEDNVLNGIMYEFNASPNGAIIRNNIARNNGGAANIYISNSHGSQEFPIRVYDNQTESHDQWEIFINDKGSRAVRSNWVFIYDNAMRMHSNGKSVTGIYGNDGGPDLSNNFRWWGNEYIVPASKTTPFLWGPGNAKTWSAWQNLSFDSDGSFKVF